MKMTKFNIYEMVTKRILEQLEQDVIPWQKPWNTGTLNGAFNRISKKPYSLLNQMLLEKPGEYATMKQWNELGGKIRKGQKSSVIVFWKIQPVEEEKEDGTKEIKQIPFLRYYNVFHISQVDGVEPLNIDNIRNDIEPIEQAEKVMNDYISREGITLEHVFGNDAYYSPIRDYIRLPELQQFSDVSEYYSTAYHECVHSTGHKSRLDRLDKTARFGNEEYSKEELTAEIGSSAIMNYLGLETKHSFRNSVGYIQNWCSVLRSDPKFIVSASSKADKAVKYILGL